MTRCCPGVRSRHSLRGMIPLQDTRVVLREEDMTCDVTRRGSQGQSGPYKISDRLGTLREQYGQWRRP